MTQPRLHWKAIRKLVLKSFFSSMHYAFATVNADGTPHVSPIGSLILSPDEPKGFYFEVFTAKTARNLEGGQRVCILAVNSSRWFFLRSLARGRFSAPSAVRLMGTSGQRRRATEPEIALMRKRLRQARWLRGYNMLWGNLEFVRDVQFDSFEPVHLGEMTRGHWDNAKT